MHHETLALQGGMCMHLWMRKSLNDTAPDLNM